MNGPFTQGRVIVGSVTGDPGIGFGAMPADIMIIGDNPPKSALKNIDEYTQSIQRLWSIFKDAFDVDFYYTFLIKTPLPKGKKRSPVRLARASYPNLLAEIDMVKPRRIICYGYHTPRLLCPDFTNLREDHGVIFSRPELDVEIIPTFEPITAYYSNEQREYFLRDLERAFTVDRPKPINIVFQNDPFFELRPNEPVYVDVETTGLDPWKDKITMLGFYQKGRAAFIVRNPTPDQARAFHKEILDKDVLVVGQNFKFDLKFLSKLAKEPFVDFPIEDTMLQARVGGERILSLKHLTTMLTDLPGPHSYGGIEDPQYLAQDLVSTAAVYDALLPRVPSDNPAFQLLNRASRAFTYIELYGACIDYELLCEMADELARNTEAAKELLNTGINLNSPQQVGPWLKSQGVPLTETTSTGQLATGAEILEELKNDYPIVQALLDYREAEKLQGYIDDYLNRVSPEYPYVNPNHKLFGARSGRTACEEPNLQNVPPYVKKLFVSRWPGGVIGVVDLDQAELRVAGILSGDKAFGEFLKQEDVHRAIASMVFGIPEDEVTDEMRKYAKQCTFGLLFGGTAWGIAQKLGTTEDVVEAVLNQIYRRFDGLTTFLDGLGAFGVENLYITSPFGRRRDLVVENELQGDGTVRRIAINTPIQTTASDVDLTILTWVWYWLVMGGYRSQVITTVHDSLVIDIHPDEVEQVANFVQLAFVALQNTVIADKFPLFWEIPFTGTLGIGRSWYDAEKEPVRTWECSSLVVEEDGLFT